MIDGVVGVLNYFVPLLQLASWRGAGGGSLRQINDFSNFDSFRK